MGVNVHRCGSLRVTEAGRNFPCIKTLRDHDCDGGVSQSVKGDRAKIVCFDDLLKFLCRRRFVKALS